jgi:hypothetical protein
MPERHVGVCESVSAFLLQHWMEVSGQLHALAIYSVERACVFSLKRRLVGSQTQYGCLRKEEDMPLLQIE